MSSLPIDSPTVSAVRGGRVPRLLAMVLAVGVGATCGWRSREIIPGVMATAGVGLGFWLGQQLSRVWPGLVVALGMAVAFLSGVKLAWESAALLALIGTVAGLRWRNDPAPALVLVTLGSWAGVAWLLWQR